MKKINFTILTMFVAAIIFSTIAYAGALTEFATCDKDGNPTGTNFTKATITVSGVDASGNYLYKGVDIGVFKKSQTSQEWITVFQKRITTNSLRIQIADFGDIKNYKQDEIYVLGYRALYAIVDSEEGSIIETDWKKIEENTFKLKGIKEETESLFKDITKSHWAYEAIEKMTKEGIISGFDDGTFRPNDKLTREQFTKIMVLGLNINAVSPKEASFADVGEEDWSYGYIETVKPYIDGFIIKDNYYFKPKNEITREEVISAIVKAKGYSNEAVDTNRVKDIFKDYDKIAPKYAKDILIAYDKKLVEGYDDGTVNPKGTLTRAEAVMLMYRIGK